MRRPVETIYDPRLSDVPPSVEVTMLVRCEGRVVAQSRAVDDTGRTRLPPGWLGLERDVRDDDLDWWWSEVATVWLDGCWERFPIPEPKQETLLLREKGTD